MNPLRVYLQNEVVSARTRRFKTWDDELPAVDRLFELHEAGAIVLGTSRQSPREMERAPAHFQEALKSPLPDLVIAENDHEVIGFSGLNTGRGWICCPLVDDIVDRPLFDALVAEGMERDDAMHLMYAVRNGFERFVTNDHRIVARRERLAAHCPTIKIVKPAALVAELTTAILPASTDQN